jgi:hypothetical protein
MASAASTNDHGSGDNQKKEILISSRSVVMQPVTMVPGKNARSHEFFGFRDRAE